MKKSQVLLLLLLFITALSLISNFSCRGSTQLNTPTISLTSIPDAEYFLIDKYPDLFWCDPDLYPVARPGVEQQKALDQFDAIRANNVEFTAILEHLNFTLKNNYTDQEKLLIYQQYKTLTYGLEITGTTSPYSFTLRTGENPGYRITGTVTSSGVIHELTRETKYNSCPICLSQGTLILTPSGSIPVENLKIGMAVWTMDKFGNKIEAFILQATRTPVPRSFVALRVQLSDGRTVMASPGHPTSVGKTLAEYQVGDVIDGAKIAGINEILYNVGFTYDILPSGDTGLYWANCILLKSTLMR